MIPLKIQPDVWRPPLIVVAGTGVGFESFLPLYAHWLEKAEVVVTSENLAEHRDLAGKEVLIVKAPIDPIIRRIIELSTVKRVLVLASGDPLFFGIGATISRHVSRENLLVLPNISVIQYFFSKICKPWNNVRFFSLHGRENREFFFWLRQGNPVVLFTDSGRNPSFIAGLISEYGFSDVTVVVGERLGSRDERIVFGKAGQVAKDTWKEPNIIALFPDREFPECPNFRDDDLYLHQAGLITKREIRAVVLGALCLKPGQVLWDLGAGSGSISVEACSSVPLRVVCAVEKDGRRYENLVKNARRWGCGEIRCVHGDAFEAVAGLPVPDRVFIGGAGHKIGDLLEAIENHVNRPVPVVSTCVTLSTLHSLENYAKQRGYGFEAFQINVCRAVPILDTHRFESLNPVWVVRLGFRQ